MALARKETDRELKAPNRPEAVADAIAGGARLPDGAAEVNAIRVSAWLLGSCHVRVASRRARRAGLAQTPTVVNGTLESRAAAQTVEREIAAIMSRASGPAWIGYAVPVNGRDREAGCWASDGFSGTHARRTAEARRRRHDLRPLSDRRSRRAADSRRLARVPARHRRTDAPLADRCAPGRQHRLAGDARHGRRLTKSWPTPPRWRSRCMATRRRPIG